MPQPRSDVEAVTEFPRLLLDNLTPPQRDRLGSFSVDVDESVGITLRDPSGAAVDSIDALFVTLGGRPSWRRPVVAEAPIPAREALVERWMRDGRTTDQMAHELNLSTRSVTTLRRRIRERADRQSHQEGSSGVSVVGRPGLTRDLVHRCLTTRRDDVNPAGVAHTDDRVRVLVMPLQRDLDLGTTGAVAIGGLPAGVSIVQAIRQGVVAAASLHVDADELCGLVDDAGQGRVAFPLDWVQRLVDELRRAGTAELSLTSRDRDVVEGIRLGESVKQTARRLGLTSKTIENRRRQLFVRFGVRSAQQLLSALGDSA